MPHPGLKQPATAVAYRLCLTTYIRFASPCLPSVSIIRSLSLHPGLAAAAAVHMCTHTPSILEIHWVSARLLCAACA